MKISSASFTKALAVSLAMFGLTQCKDPDPSQRSLPASADASASANCLSGGTALTSSSWQSGIGTIFTSNCGSCHPGSQSSNYTLYANVKANIASIASSIQSGAMPKGKTMTQADKDALSAWVLAGAPETDGGAAVPTASADPNAAPNNCIPASTTYPSGSPSPSPSGGVTGTPSPSPT